MSTRVLLSLCCSIVLAACGAPTSSGTGGGGGTASVGGGQGGGNGQGGGGAASEICDNHIDDDGDGLTDCADNDCFQNTACFASCVDLCTDGTSICDGAGTRTCELDTNLGCRVFGAVTACNNGLVCSGGACVATCTDQCTENAKQCASTGAIVECQRLSTGCTDWVLGANGNCATGEVCSGGACVPRASCTNQCTAGASRCTASGQVETCVQLSSGCTDWTFPSNCPSGQACQAGGTTCTALPTCTQGQTRCGTSSPTVETCDGNGNWTATQMCPQACLNGACTAAATCTPGNVRCNGTNIEVCNSSGSAWLYRETCAVSCNAASGLCTDPCQEGVTRCNGNTVETCLAGGTSWGQPNLPDGGSPQCTNGCYRGGCMDADLIIDGITKTMEGDFKFSNSVIIRNGGQLRVGPTGNLSIQAKNIVVQDSASQVNANGVGDTAASGQTISVYSHCHNGYLCCNGAYDLNTSVLCIAGNTTQCTGGNPCVGYGYNASSVRTDDLSAAEGFKYTGSDFGGGLVRFTAESIDVRGQMTANGTNTGTGGTILLAADTISGDGALQSTGGSNGFLKLLRGSTDSYTGSTSGTTVRSVMPPLDVVSGSHPDSLKWYNDGLGDLFLAWTKPFPTINGYYYKTSTSASTLPSQTAGNGTFLQAESIQIPETDLVQGANYFHIVSVDSSFNVGGVKNTFKVNINTQPPSVSSASHPSQRTWYQNPAVYFSWTNPQDDANFDGYYYAFDHFADTVPATTQQNFTSNKQVLLANTPDGIWVFHVVNRDTRGAITKAARHFVVYVGVEPAKENISGSVFDASNGNAPLSGVTISVNRGLFTTTSSGSGTYTFNGNQYVGQWELTASKAGYVSQTKMVTLVAGTPLNENFTLTAAP